MTNPIENLRRAYITLKANPKALVQVFIPEEARYLPFTDGDIPAQTAFMARLQDKIDDGELLGYSEEQVEGGHKITLLRGKNHASNG